MNKFIMLAIKNKRIVLFLTLIITLVGIYSYYLLPKQENPEVSSPIAMIITAYPGANPNDIKDLVTKKIEDELVDLDGYDKCQGISREGISVVTVEFKNNTDADKAMQDVRNAVADVQADLPSGCFPSQTKTDLMETAGIVISLSGQTYSYEQLASFGELFENKLANIDGVSKYDIKGDLDKEVKVDVDIAKLNQLGLSIDDICNILSAQNVQIPSGSIDYTGTKVTVSTPGIYESLDDIKNTILAVSSETGVVTKLCDTADVYMGLEEGVQKFKQNGQNAVLLTVNFQKSKNIVIIGKDVRTAIDEVKAQLPKDLIVEEVIYQPEDVSESTNEFMFHLILGILLVTVVVFIGMGFRNAMVVSTAIPLSILMTFVVMYIAGIEIQKISLTALIIALGILVDNAIVVCDTIQTKMDEGESKLEAVYAGTRRCVVPVFTATLTIIAAISPLIGIPGTAGQFLISISLVLITSIIASYIVAMFITPSLAMYTFKANKNHSEKQNLLRRFFVTLLAKSLTKKKTVVVVMVLLFVVVIKILVPQLSSQFFPYIDKNLCYIDITSEKADIDTTELLTDKIAALLAKEPEITSKTVSIGDGMPKFYITMAPASPSNDFAQMVCKFDLGRKDQRYKTNEEFAYHIQQLLDENIAGGKCKVNLLAYAKPAEAPVILKISGKNLEQLTEVSNQFVTEIGKLPGVFNVRKDLKDSTYQLEVTLDNDKASSLGITKYDVQKQINIALYGSNASVYRRDGEAYNILVKSNIDSVALLKNLKVKSSVTGSKVPVNEFAAVGLNSKLDKVNTYKREQTISVLLDLTPGYNATDMENTIEASIVPKIDTLGTGLIFQGEREDIKDSFGPLGVLALAAIFVIYLILLFQFKSFLQPLVILLTIPLSLIGSVIGLVIMKQPLSMTAALGIIALIGLVIKNGILLIDYINEARGLGYSIDEACKDGVDKRYNAIILSALTVILGMIPLAVSGNALFAPMAIALMSGLAVSTFLTMVVIPVVYSMIETALERKQKHNKDVTMEISG